MDATRIGIARELNLSLVKLSSILNGLESKQFIDKVGNVQAKSGRPSYLFQLRPETGCFLEEKQDATGR